MASIKHTAAAILVREGVDYAQSKAVFKAARERAGLRAAPCPAGSARQASARPSTAAWWSDTPDRSAAGLLRPARGGRQGPQARVQIRSHA
jgi:hypothetical protein